MLCKREARREVVDGIQTLALSSNLLLDFLRRSFLAVGCGVKRAS